MLFSLQKHSKTFSLRVFFFCNGEIYGSSQVRYNTDEFIKKTKNTEPNFSLKHGLGLEPSKLFFENLIVSLIYQKFMNLKYDEVYSTVMRRVNFSYLREIKIIKTSSLEELLSEIIKCLNTKEKTGEVLIRTILDGEIKIKDIFNR